MITTKQHARVLVRVGIGLVAAVAASAAVAQQEPAAAAPTENAEPAPSHETPIRQPPATTDADGKPVPLKPEKRVLADPDSKRYMPCREPNESRPGNDAANAVKLNPKAAVLSEEAAKQHGYKPSPHKVDCPPP